MIVTPLVVAAEFQAADRRTNEQSNRKRDGKHHRLKPRFAARLDSASCRRTYYISICRVSLCWYRGTAKVAAGEWRGIVMWCTVVVQTVDSQAFDLSSKEKALIQLHCKTKTLHTFIFAVLCQNAFYFDDFWRTDAFLIICVFGKLIYNTATLPTSRDRCFFYHTLSFWS